MADISKDAWLNRSLKGLKLADHVYSDESIRWGEFIEPSSDPRPAPSDTTFRVAVIASLPVGFLVLKTLLALAKCQPDKLYITCVLTDDPVNSDAKVSARKRIWHIYPENERRQIELQTVKAALSEGIPVYTGDIKQDWFRTALSELKPDAVLCCGFGQLIDAKFLKIPQLGVYNFHPSDLAQGHGAGPAPFEDCKARGASTTCWTVHLMNEAIDDGHIVGSSPPINIRTADGSFPDDPVDYYSKVADALDHLAAHTLYALLVWHGQGHRTPLRALDYDALFPAAVKERMLKPVGTVPEVLFPDPALFSDT